MRRKIAVVEDELYWQQEIVRILGDLYEEPEFEMFSSGEEFLADGRKYDMVILDIELPEMSGLDVAQQYRKRYTESILIILTAHLEYSREGYLVDAFRYVDKMKIKPELEEAVISAKRRLGEQKEVLLHIVNFGDTNIRCRDIRYFETCKRNVLVHGVTDSYLCSDNIKNLAQQLEDAGFLYIHRSYLVNADYMRRFLDKDVLMDNGEKIMVSSRKRADMKRQFVKWKQLRGMR
ncbi:MAG: LytTR family DNA-binding domain-containing protein [Clostridiales bacterium]|nr:LytTR family DNA-binding domain-containing protein [Clostridiales bacterium]